MRVVRLLLFSLNSFHRNPTLGTSNNFSHILSSFGFFFVCLNNNTFHAMVYSSRAPFFPHLSPCQLHYKKQFHFLFFALFVFEVADLCTAGTTTFQLSLILFLFVFVCESVCETRIAKQHMCYRGASVIMFTCSLFTS